MANIKSAAKHARSSLVRRARNNAVKSEIKTRRKYLLEAVKKGDASAARAAYQEFSSILDSAAKRGIIHKNAANRNKSRGARLLLQTGAKAEAAA